MDTRRENCRLSILSCITKATQMTRPQRIGFIGLGMMGTPMVQCLAKAGFELYLADADTSRTDALAKEVGAVRLDAANAASLDALITMLPNSAIVESVLLDGDAKAWARLLPRGAVVIDMSSSEPERSRKLGATLAKMGLDYLDAPVSGGVKKAKEGTLAILAGGDASVLDTAGPCSRPWARVCCISARPGRDMRRRR
jgi:3-hydroxyisobutyrate dehydrogenase